MTSQPMLQVQRVSLIVTKKCTLKCKLCGALAPYVEHYHPNVDYLKSEIDSFFDVVEKVNIIDISGGEPMIRTSHSDFALGEILLYITECYKGRFEHLRVFTNGTIVPGKEISDVFRLVSERTSFSITIDNYGKYSPKTQEIADCLKEANVRYDIRDYSNDIHCGGWVDLRDISLKYPEVEDAKRLFSKCAIPQKLGCCLELMDGIISPCSVAAGRYLCGKAEKEDKDIVDLFAGREEVYKKLKDILCAEYFPSCHYCVGGLSDDSERVVPAEQATNEDILEWKQKYDMRM